MSADDRELIERLLDAGRRDAAPDGTERQARIYEGVLAGGGGGESGPLGSRKLGSWGRLSVVGLGALVLIGAGSAALSGSAAKSSDVPTFAEAPASPPPPPAAPPSVSVETRHGASASAQATSVWELPAAREPEKALTAPSAEADELALQLAALASARKRLREHDAAGALKLLDHFDRRFPRPRVGEEIAVLRVEVLFALGRSEEARRLGEGFVAKHPGSIYRARVAQVLGDSSP